MPSAVKSVPFLSLICSSVNSAQGHLMTLIQGADNQVTSHFCTGPCPRVGTMMDGEVQITWMPSSPTYMWKQVWSTVHGHSSQKTDLSESHTLGQSWDCTQGSSVHPHWLCFPRHTCEDCELHVSLCFVEEGWGAGFSPFYTHQSLQYEQKPFVSLEETTI